MKARIKATGHIVDVELSHYIDDVAWYITKYRTSFPENELEFIDAPEDYWERLEHTYAGMAMQGILANIDLFISLAKKKASDYPAKYIAAEFAKDCAHALVEKMKEERK